MEKAIIVDRVSKNFEVIERQAGLMGGIKNLIRPQKKMVRALKSISFSIDQGELVGFIGPNGAGKTTTLKILSGLLYPTGGFTQVLGFDPWERRFEYLRQISLVMGQKNQLWWDLPAIDAIELNKAIYEIPDHKYQKTLEELTTLLDVKKLMGVQVRRLSLGQRMRLELVAALVHQPKILFLDEPTIGLDVIAQTKLRDFIADYNRRYQATILLTSHNMDDVSDLARRVIVINKGEIIFDGDLNELIAGYSRKRNIYLHLAKEIDFKQLEKIGKVKKLDMPRVILSVPRETAAIAASELLQNFPIEDLTIEEEAIEEIIKRVFKGEKINSPGKKTKK